MEQFVIKGKAYLNLDRRCREIFDSLEAFVNSAPLSTSEAASIHGQIEAIMQEFKALKECSAFSVFYFETLECLLGEIDEAIRLIKSIFEQQGIYNTTRWLTDSTEALAAQGVKALIELH